MKRAAAARIVASRSAALALLPLFLSSGPARAQETLTLEEALQTALVRSPAVESARAAATAAAAARWAQWGAFLPTARLSGFVSRTDFRTITFLTPEGSSQTLAEPLDDVTKGNQGVLSLELPLLSPERIGALRSGGAELDAAEFRISAAERTVVRDVKRAYFEALKQQKLTDVAERQLEARRQDFEVSERRYRIAAASRSDLLGAEIDLNDARVRLDDARDAFSRALRQLEVVLAADVTESPRERYRLVDVESVPDASSLDPAALVQEARSGSPTLQALRLDERAAAASLWSERASYLPRIDIGLSFGRSKRLGATEGLFDFDPANTSTTFTISGSWDLFAGFSRRERTARAGQQLRQVRAELTAQRLQLEKEVRDLVEELSRRARRLEVLERNVSLAGERVELARQQYRLGSIPYFNLQQAIDRLNQAEQSLFQERYDFLIGWADLEERAGSGAW